MRIFRHSSFEIKTDSMGAPSFAEVNHFTRPKIRRGDRISNIQKTSALAFLPLQKKSGKDSLYNKCSFSSVSRVNLVKISSFPLMTRVFCWVGVGLLWLRVSLKALEWGKISVAEKNSKIEDLAIFALFSAK